MISLIASVAITDPTWPHSAPSTPACAQDGTAEGSGGSGNRSRSWTAGTAGRWASPEHRHLGVEAEHRAPDLREAEPHARVVDQVARLEGVRPVDHQVVVGEQVGGLLGQPQVVDLDPHALVELRARAPQHWRPSGARRRAIRGSPAAAGWTARPRRRRRCRGCRPPPPRGRAGPASRARPRRPRTPWRCAAGVARPRPARAAAGAATNGPPATRSAAGRARPAEAGPGPMPPVRSR